MVPVLIAIIAVLFCSLVALATKFQQQEQRQQRQTIRGQYDSEVEKFFASRNVQWRDPASHAGEEEVL